MRQDIYDMFTQYQAEFQYKWNKIIAAGFDAFEVELEQLAQRFGLSQSKADKRVLWKNAQGQVEAMFAYIIDPTDIDGIISTYVAIKDNNSPLTFAFIEQREDGEGQYDIFRLSEKSYTEHNNRAWAEGTSCDQ